MLLSSRIKSTRAIQSDRLSTWIFYVFSGTRNTCDFSELTSSCFDVQLIVKARDLFILYTLLLNMEVASPLTFTPGQAGTKRAFPCSPGLDSTAPIGMEISEDYGQQSFKRRRFNENSDPTQQNTSHAANPFAMHAKSPPNGAFLFVIVENRLRCERFSC